MKCIISILLFLNVPSSVFAQPQSDKPIIDTGMLNTWPLPVDMKLTPDGNYVSYLVVNKPYKGKTLILQGTRNNWEKEFSTPSPQFLFFSADSKKAVCTVNDSLFLYTLGEEELHFIDVVKELQMPETKGKWVVYKAPTRKGEMTLLNVVTGEKKHFPSISGFGFTGNTLIATSITLQGHQLEMITLDNLKVNTIWSGPKGEEPGNFIFDKSFNHLAFSVQDTAQNISIWYYKIGTSHAFKKIEQNYPGINKELSISSPSFISGNGRWLFFRLGEKRITPRRLPGKPWVDIWSYKDSVLNPAQNPLSRKEYTAVYDLKRGTFLQIGNDTTEIAIENVPNDHVLLVQGGLIHAPSHLIESWWPHSPKQSYWLLSLTDGHKKLIFTDNYKTKPYLFSHTGRFILFWNGFASDFLSYDINTDKLINLTSSLPESASRDYEELELAIPVGIAGWHKTDSLVFVYGNYDIYKLDLTGSIPFVNITNGFGLRNHIKLRFVYQNIFDKTSLHGTEEILLTGLNDVTMYNGFYKIRLNKIRNPQTLTEGPYHYHTVESQRHYFSFSYSNEPPLASSTSQKPCWIILRHSFNEYPNYYFTEDFRLFKPLTNLHPQKSFNWLTAELVSWRMHDGKTSLGILYKPENFDSTKKYPIVFNFYEKLSQRLFQFPTPSLSVNNIDIPWFVSRGYLVFTPDIHYTIANRSDGRTIGESACNAVVSAAELLSRRSYVDPDRMGIQGHSFGGMESSYIATHSKLFAAAAEMAGTTDYLNSYITLVAGVMGDGTEKASKQDHFQGRMGATPWERPDLYRRNSAILNADQTVCPLLITHNKRDYSINYRQGVGLYLAMRRLGKPCWMLQYDNSGHTLNSYDALDYTIRLTQYFDHYLKYKPAPKWMTQGMPAVLKGAETAYELDMEGMCSKTCKVCNTLLQKKP